MVTKYLFNVNISAMYTTLDVIVIIIDRDDKSSPLCVLMWVEKILNIIIHKNKREKRRKEDD